jgi:hypothetical protein
MQLEDSFYDHIDIVTTASGGSFLAHLGKFSTEMNYPQHIVPLGYQYQSSNENHFVKQDGTRVPLTIVSGLLPEPRRSSKLLHRHKISVPFGPKRRLKEKNTINT